MPYIFHVPLVTICLPVDIKFDDHTVVYELINPIRSTIFNFNKFIRNLDIKALLQYDSVLNPICEGSDFIDKITKI